MRVSEVPPKYGVWGIALIFCNSRLKLFILVHFGRLKGATILFSWWHLWSSCPLPAC